MFILNFRWRNYAILIKMTVASTFYLYSLSIPISLAFPDELKKYNVSEWVRCEVLLTWNSVQSQCETQEWEIWSKHLFSLWSQKQRNANETRGVLENPTWQETRQRFENEAPSWCAFAENVLEDIISESWWGSWKWYRNTAFGHIGYSSSLLSIGRKSQCELIEIYFLTEKIICWLSK